MTESEWLASNDPAAMLRFLTEEGIKRVPPQNTPDGRLSTPRKFRLFACACCLQVRDGLECQWCFGSGIETYRDGGKVSCEMCHGTGRAGGLADERSQRAVEVAERYADGEATEEELESANIAASADDLIPLDVVPSDLPSWVAMGNESLGQICRVMTQYGPQVGVPPAIQATLLRDIFGNPFRPVTIEHATDCPSWVGKKTRRECGCRSPWLSPAVLVIAEVIYRDRRWHDMPILADALEEAGCDNEDLLRHCRQTFTVRYEFAGATGHWGTYDSSRKAEAEAERCQRHFFGNANITIDGPAHARGCWLLDLILGKS